MVARFRYFEHPHQFSTYREERQRCEVCGREAMGYAGPFFGIRDIEFVCEDCLSTGRLREHDATANNADVMALRQQMYDLHPDISEVEREQIVRERTSELEQCTPHLVTWQDFFWPAHCGDYCCFIKEIGQPELTHLSPDGDGIAFFEAHALDIETLDHAREVWEGIRPDSPTDGRIAYPVGVYLFRCLICGEHMLLWDCN
jgi:uncharacterized protein CbrC (UPF0167 family)